MDLITKDGLYQTVCGWPVRIYAVYPAQSIDHGCVHGAVLIDGAHGAPWRALEWNRYGKCTNQSIILPKVYQQWREQFDLVEAVYSVWIAFAITDGQVQSFSCRKEAGAREWLARIGVGAHNVQKFIKRVDCRIDAMQKVE